MKKGNTTKLFVTVLAASIFLTGCQSADVDYNLNESQEEGQETEQESLSTLSQFSNLEPWNELFTVENDGKEIPVQIESEIQVPKTDHLSVIEVKVPEIEEEDFSYTEKMAFPVEKRVTTELDRAGEGVELTLLEKQLFIYVYPTDFTEAIPEEVTVEGALYDAYYPDEGEELGENLCKYSRKEAEELAQKFIEEAGFTGYQPNKTGELHWLGDYEGDEIQGHYNQKAIDGYVIRFELEDEAGSKLDVSQHDYDDLIRISTGTMYDWDSYIEVYVVDEGIMEIQFCNPVHVVETSSVVNLLSFGSVQKIFRAALQEDFAGIYLPNEKFNWTKGTVLFNSVELTYFRIRDKEKEGCYSYIPVWLFCRREKLGGEVEKVIYTPILINAIDGTIINLREEF